MDDLKTLNTKIKILEYVLRLKGFGELLDKYDVWGVFNEKHCESCSCK